MTKAAKKPNPKSDVELPIDDATAEEALKTLRKELLIRRRAQEPVTSRRPDSVRAIFLEHPRARDQAGRGLAAGRDLRAPGRRSRFGKITRLLINVPPGSMKSLMVNVFFPAWEWGPMGMPHLRYVSFSYSSA